MRISFSRNTYICLFFILVVILSNCGNNFGNHEVDSRLRYADSIIETDPSESLRIIDSISITSKNLNESQKALLTLLKVQSREKLEFPLENRKQLDEIIQYFDKNGPSNYLIRSLYYKARYDWINDSLSSAIQSLSPAYEISVECEDVFWRAKCADLFGDIYRSNYNARQALTYFKESSTYYEKANETRYSRFAHCDAAIMLSDMRELDKAKSILDSIHHIAIIEKKDTLLSIYSLSPLLPISVWQGKFVDTQKYFRELKRYENFNPPTSRDYSYASRAELELGNVGYARQLLDSAYVKALNYQDSAIAYISKAALANATGNHTVYNESMDTVLNSINKMTELAIAESPSIDLKNIYKSKSETEHSHSKKLHSILLFGELMTLIIGSLFLTLYTVHIKRKNYKLSELNSYINELNNQLVELKQFAETQKISIIGSVLEDKMSLINNIYNEYDRKANDPQLRESFVSELKNIIESLSSEDFITRLRALNNSLWPGMLEEIRTKVRKFSKKDEYIILYLFSGFNITTLSIIMKESKSTLYTRRRRLHDKINEADIKDKDTIITILMNGFTQK